jgi:large subunit ribosomal protein L33
MSSKVVLACNECGSRNYTAPNNRSGKQDRLELKKFCSTCNAHTVHRETK